MNVLILSNTPRVLILSLLSPQSPVLLLTVSMNHEPTLQALKTILIHSSGGSHRVRLILDGKINIGDGWASDNGIYGVRDSEPSIILPIM